MEKIKIETRIRNHKRATGDKLRRHKKKESNFQKFENLDVEDKKCDSQRKRDLKRFMKMVKITGAERPIDILERKV